MGDFDEKAFEEAVKAIVQSINKVELTDEQKISFFEVRTENFMKKFFSCYFDTIEGSCCSVDKAGFVCGAIQKTLETKKYISLQQTYREYQALGGNLGGIGEDEEDDLDEIAYWCPKTLETTKEAMALYEDFIHESWPFMRDFFRQRKEEEDSK